MKKRAKKASVSGKSSKIPITVLVPAAIKLNATQMAEFKKELEATDDHFSISVKRAAKQDLDYVREQSWTEKTLIAAENLILNADIILMSMNDDMDSFGV